MKGLELIVREYRHRHLVVGAIGNAMVLIGSILFFRLFEACQTFAVWLFVIGSALMLFGSRGEMAKAVYEKRELDAVLR